MTTKHIHDKKPSLLDQMDQEIKAMHKEVSFCTRLKIRESIAAELSDCFGKNCYSNGF
jgi:hypothetical protein